MQLTFTEYLPLDSEFVCKTMERASGGENNWHQLNWAAKTEEILFFILTVPILYSEVWSTHEQMIWTAYNSPRQQIYHLKHAVISNAQ